MWELGMASAELSAFFSGLAADPERLGAFMRDPARVLAESDLTEEDKAVVLSGDPDAIRARLQPESVLFIAAYLLVANVQLPALVQAFFQAFSEAFSEAFPQAFSQALTQALGQTFPSAFPDANTDTRDAGSPAEQSEDGT
jgi:hypothetical protein